ncbi:hypothetical protein ACQ4PT_028936 [Festuca glaucescens]
MASHSQIEQDDELTMSTDEFLLAEMELYHHCIAFVKSLALKAATDLRVADAIHRRGGGATLSELAAETGIHPTKLSNLRRLMRVLSTSGVFSVVNGRDHAVGVHVDPFALTALLKMPEWFTDERASALSLFELAHGRPFWDTDIAVNDGGLFIGAMAADSRVAMQVLLKEYGGVFGEVRGSLVDVGGSHGATQWRNVTNN